MIKAVFWSTLQSINIVTIKGRINWVLAARIYLSTTFALPPQTGCPWSWPRVSRALPSSLQREGLEQLRVYESEYERRCMVEYEYAMYAPYHPDLLVF